MKRELDACALIEQSITKAFRKTLWKPFVEALKRYELIKAGDRIAVCISGGKDSMLLAKLLEQLQKHSDVPFELRYLVMDPGYRADNRALIEQNAALLRIPIEVFETNIFAAADNSRGQSPCYLCARMRRGALYHAAQERGCNKIALGHHRSDVIETTVMGMLYGSQLQAMPPMLYSKNFPGMSLIRPMYCIREEDIVAWKVQNGLRFLQCACRFTEQCEDGTGAVQSKRAEVKKLIKTLRETNPGVEESIFNSIHCVCLDTMVGYKSEGVRHSFLERYRAECDAAERDEEIQHRKGKDRSMGFLKRLFRVGATAGATVAAMKVAEKYKKNNPNGVGDVNGDGKVDSADVLIEVGKAAREVYDNAAAAVNNMVNGVKAEPERQTREE